jgi:thiol-disulfide isomerase/thioredoxin
MSYRFNIILAVTIFATYLIVTNLLAGKIDDFTLKDLNNKRVSFSEVKGEKLTMIDFWATWCKPCARAIPELIILYEAYKDSGIQVIGISVDSPRNQAKVRPFVNSKGITYPILLDSNSELMSELQVSVLPTLLIIDDQDEIVFIHRGYRPGDEIILKKEIDKWLIKKSPESEDE